MADPVAKTQEQLPLDGDPIQNVEDPGKVAEIFQKSAEQLKKEAAASLEYAEEETPPAPAVEKEAAAELEAEPEKKPAKKVKAKVKDEPVTEPEVEKEVEATAEPQKSKRELFKERADADKTNRDKETRLKEREAKVQAQLEEITALKRQLDDDPIAYLEKKDPRLYEKWTERNLAEKKTPESSELASLRSEVAELKKTTETKHEDTTKQIQMAEYERQLNDGERILAGSEYDTVRESAALYEKFTGQPTDYRKALAGVWLEYVQMYKQELTPAECCEILLEDAQAHVERVGKEFGQKPAEKKQPPKKKAPPTGKTITNAQETASAPAQEFDPGQYKTKEELLAAVSGTLEYEEESAE